MALQHDDRATLAEQANARTTVPAALDQKLGSVHEHHDHDHEEDHDHSLALEWPEAARIAFVALAAAAVWFKLWEPFPAVSLIGVAGLLVGGWPILKEAFENVLEQRMTMELSMTIAIAVAAAIGQFFTALIITLFVLVAEVLEGLTVGRGRKAIGCDPRRFRRRAAYRRCHPGCSWWPHPGGRDCAVGSLFRG